MFSRELHSHGLVRASAQFAVLLLMLASSRPASAEHKHDDHVEFSIKSVSSGEWSDAKTWEPARVPKQGDRVLISGDAETHFRNVTVNRPAQFADRWPLINRGVGPRVPPLTTGVPIYIHDYFGAGRHAKVVSTAAQELVNDGNDYKSMPPLIGDESLVAEVKDAPWPDLLDPGDDVPPATIITSVQQQGGKVIVRGVSHDNGEIVSVSVNGTATKVLSSAAGVVHWQVKLALPSDGKLIAFAKDRGGNVEQTAHIVNVVARTLAAARVEQRPANLRGTQ